MGKGPGWRVPHSVDGASGLPSPPPKKKSNVLCWLLVVKFEAYNSMNGIKKLEIAQSEQDVSPFCKESDMTYS